MQWTQAQQGVLDELAGADSVLCYVPGWNPVGLDEALKWLERTRHRGLEVDYRVVHEPRGAKVWFKSWELEDPEPDWGEDWPEGPEES